MSSLQHLLLRALHQIPPGVQLSISLKFCFNLSAKQWRCTEIRSREVRREGKNQSNTLAAEQDKNSKISRPKEADTAVDPKEKPPPPLEVLPAEAPIAKPAAPPVEVVAGVVEPKEGVIVVDTLAPVLPESTMGVAEAGAPKVLFPPNEKAAAAGAAVEAPTAPAPAPKAKADEAGAGAAAPEAVALEVEDVVPPNAKLEPGDGEHPHNFRLAELINRIAAALVAAHAQMHIHEATNSGTVHAQQSGAGCTHSPETPTVIIWGACVEEGDTSGRAKGWR